MSRINANTTLRVEDYPQTYRKDLLPRLFQVLNLLNSQIIAAINGGIQFGINIPSQDNALEFNYNPLAPISFKWNQNTPPKFVLFGQAFEAGQPVSIDFTWSYDSSSGLVTVVPLNRTDASKTSALIKGTKYDISLRTLA